MKTLTCYGQPYATVTNDQARPAAVKHIHACARADVPTGRIDWYHADALGDVWVASWGGQWLNHSIEGVKERDRRSVWRQALDRLADELGEPRPESWQLDLAERILARQPRRSVTGGGDIWVTAQMSAQELVREMKADGRLNEWGNWPS